MILVVERQANRGNRTRIRVIRVDFTKVPNRSPWSSWQREAPVPRVYRASKWIQILTEVVVNTGATHVLERARQHAGTVADRARAFSEIQQRVGGL